MSTAISGADTKVLLARSKCAVTFFMRHTEKPLQVVTSTYRSLEVLLAGFDIDASCCGFSLGADKFLCTPRCLRALRTRTNLMDSRRHSGSYFTRLEKCSSGKSSCSSLRSHGGGHSGCVSKSGWRVTETRYAARGFAVGIPGLQRELLKPSLLSTTYLRMLKYDLLLHVTSMGEPGCTFLQMPAGSSTLSVRCRKQVGVKVEGIRRLIVLHFNRRIKFVEPPFIARGGPQMLVAQNVDEGVVPHVFFWGAVCYVFLICVFLLCVCYVFCYVFCVMCLLCVWGRGGNPELWVAGYVFSM